MTGKKKRRLQERYEELDLSVPLDDDEAEEIIAAANIDATASLTRLMARLDDVEEEMRKTSFERADAERRKWLRRLEPCSTPRSREDLLAIIATLKSQDVEVQAMYKNLDDVPDEDLESLVAELELLAGDDEES